MPVVFYNPLKQQDIMAYWMTSAQIAAKYGVSEQEVLSWAMLKEISSSCIGDTLMIDDDSVDFYLGTKKMLAEKQAIRERLIREEDNMIEQELKKYDATALFIRLQSECFPLFELLVKALSAMIPNIQDRKLFCAITGGFSLKQIPKYQKMSNKDAFQVYLKIVRKLQADIKYILIMQRQADRTLDKIVKGEKEHKKRLEQESNDWKEKCGQLYDELSHREKEKESWILLESSLRKEIFEHQKNELRLKNTLHDSGYRLDATKKETEEHPPVCTKKKQELPFYLPIIDWIVDFVCHIKRWRNADTTEPSEYG